jgi:murein DD-endopeptidase MepM/ murein hydrolase activator NlpD
MLGDGERLHQLAAALPLGRPTRGESVVSSPFGTRLDPFTRGLALHTGLDLKAESGEPARATAHGRVSAADYAGGYGNMVEIDHGHGVVTRFGHLARISVRPGQHVAAGDVVGLVGSTGRSTGAHLHYETRVDGEPVDPQRFLEAGGDRTAALAAD